jgi:hypothetical protein
MMQRWSEKYRTTQQSHGTMLEKKREEIIKKLTEVKETLAQLQLNTTIEGTCTTTTRLLRKRQCQCRRQYKL